MLVRCGSTVMLKHNLHELLCYSITYAKLITLIAGARQDA